MSGPAALSFRIGVDVGGTFTDIVVLDGSSRTHVCKSPSNPSDPAAGVLAAVDMAAKQIGTTTGELLRNCTVFVHGSTIATNTLLEKKGAVVGLLTTQGFRDSLEVRRCIKANVWDHRAPVPEVLVPRYRRLSIPERMDHLGNVLTPLDESAVRETVTTLRSEGVESLAICFLHSYANSAHERRARDIVRELWPNISISCSSDVAPIIGEYERSSTTVVNAYVAPRVIPYLRALDKALAERGLLSGLLLIQSNGGGVSVNELADRPIQLILSGQAAGVGAIRFFASDIKTPNLVAIEVGGTSCDVTLSVEGVTAMTDQLEIDGYHLAMSAVDIHTVGAGGGTIAHVDPAGLLHAGPKGAGARPGPASYGRGGDKPTVTDAQLVLGRLKPGPYAGGVINLDIARARDAIETHVAKPLGLSVEEAASGILRLADQHMNNAVERVTTQRGYNPREFTLIAAGGAGPLHGVSVARALGCPAVYIPRLAGVFCAFGMCNTDLRHDYQRPWFRNLDDPNYEHAATAAFADMEAEAAPVLAREGFSGANVENIRGLDLRYYGQQWLIKVEPKTLAPADVRAAFEAEHRRLYGYVQPNGLIEIVNLRIAAFGHISIAEIMVAGRNGSKPNVIDRRPIWIDAATGTKEVPIYDGRTLRAQDKIIGPAVIDESTTTLFIGPGDELTVTDAENYLIRLASKAGSGGAHHVH